MQTIDNAEKFKWETLSGETKEGYDGPVSVQAYEVYQQAKEEQCAE